MEYIDFLKKKVRALVIIGKEDDCSVSALSNDLTSSYDTVRINQGQFLETFNTWHKPEVEVVILSEVGGQLESLRSLKKIKQLMTREYFTFNRKYRPGKLVKTPFFIVESTARSPHLISDELYTIIRIY